MFENIIWEQFWIRKVIHCSVQKLRVVKKYFQRGTAEVIDFESHEEVINLSKLMFLGSKLDVTRFVYVKLDLILTNF